MLKSAGIPLTDKEFQACVEIGLEPPESNASSNTYFWFNMYARIKERQSPTSPQELQAEVVKFWRTFQSAAIVSQENLNTEAKEPSFERKQSQSYAKATAHAATGQFCKSCAENGREKVSKSHNDDGVSLKSFMEKTFLLRKMLLKEKVRQTMYLAFLNRIFKRWFPWLKNLPIKVALITSTIQVQHLLLSLTKNLRNLFKAQVKSKLPKTALVKVLVMEKFNLEI